MPNQAPYYVTAAVATAGAIGGVYYIYRYYQNNKSQKLPEQWRQVGTLKSIYVYPIKSCGPVMLDTAECSILGLKDESLRDRVLMIVDDKNNFVTARGYPELLTVEPTVKNSILTVTHQDIKPLQVNLAEIVATKKTTTATVWSITVPVYDCGKEASEWFSRFINRPSATFRLVYYASQHSRKFRGHMNGLYKYTKNDTGALPDEVPFNLINEASVIDLNTRIKDCQISERNFRPNFVLSSSDGKPYDEDNWEYVKIGGNVFQVIKPCFRCILTTIDPETGVKSTTAEPLNTLKSYRQMLTPEERKEAGNSPRMGIQMSLRSQPGGTVSLNDPIYVA